MSAIPPVLLFLRKNAAPAGLYNPIVSMWSPFQSPASGMNPIPAGPNVKVISATPPVFEFLRKNDAVAGSYRPIVSTPSPFQSPVIGMRPIAAGPYVKLISATPPVLEFLKKKLAVDGSYTPIVVLLPQLFKRIDTVAAFSLAVARSSLPSRLKSPTATDSGPLPVPKSVAAPKLPLPVPN